MFTIKFYSDDGYRQRILEAESFTILRDASGEGAEITLHRKDQKDDIRIDVTYMPAEGRYRKAIIENAAGRTTEIIAAQMPGSAIPKAA